MAHRPAQAASESSPGYLCTTTPDRGDRGEDATQQHEQHGQGTGGGGWPLAYSSGHYHYRKSSGFAVPIAFTGQTGSGGGGGHSSALATGTSSSVTGSTPSLRVTTAKQEGAGLMGAMMGMGTPSKAPFRKLVMVAGGVRGGEGVGAGVAMAAMHALTPFHLVGFLLAATGLLLVHFSIARAASSSGVLAASLSLRGGRQGGREPLPQHPPQPHHLYSAPRHPGGKPKAVGAGGAHKVARPYILQQDADQAHLPHGDVSISSSAASLSSSAASLSSSAASLSSPAPLALAEEGEGEAGGAADQSHLYPSHGSEQAMDVFSRAAEKRADAALAREPSPDSISPPADTLLPRPPPPAAAEDEGAVTDTGAEEVPAMPSSEGAEEEEEAAARSDVETLEAISKRAPSTPASPTPPPVPEGEGEAEQEGEGVPAIPAAPATAVALKEATETLQAAVAALQAQIAAQTAALAAARHPPPGGLGQGGEEGQEVPRRHGHDDHDDALAALVSDMVHVALPEGKAAALPPSHDAAGGREHASFGGKDKLQLKASCVLAEEKTAPAKARALRENK